MKALIAALALAMMTGCAVNVVTVNVTDSIVTADDYGVSENYSNANVGNAACYPAE